MPNDDLGSFPTPQQTPVTPIEPPVASTQFTSPAPQPQPDPIVPSTPSISEPAMPPIIPQEAVTPAPQEPQNPAFEETPDEIPSVPTVQDLATHQDNLVSANETMMDKQANQETVAPIGEIPEPQPLPQPEPVTPIDTAPVAAVLPPKTGKSIAPIIIIVLLVVAGIGLAAAAYLSSQSNKLKTQLQEITQTLEKQQTTLTPTATPTVFSIPTPTIATQSGVVATPSATPTITPTVTPTISLNLPLKNAATVLKVAIGRSPNAQLILIKVDNATDPTTSVTKYFFREDTTTKKYFYVAISGKGTPEIIDKQIYVTPDDNIPSLNDAVLSNKLGIELDEAIRITYTQCANQATCIAAPIKAQYIKTSTGIIWQLSLYTKGLSATPLMIQLNAETKAILYKSPEFANK